MKVETIPLGGSAGTRHELLVRRYGTPGARPKVYVQAGLHADEMPGVLTAHHLCGLLDGAAVTGEVVVLPLANPLGLAQRGFAVTVLEKADTLGEIGAGIQLGPNAFHAFDYLGIGDMRGRWRSMWTGCA